MLRWWRRLLRPPAHAARPATVQRRLEALARAVFGAGDREAAARVLRALRLRHLKFWHDPTVVSGLAGAVDEVTTDDPDQWSLLRDVAANARGRRQLLDFGCGAKADHRQSIEAMGFDWRGLEVADTRDPGTRTKLSQLVDDPQVTLYEGRRIPFADGVFDVVFSNQSLEHVHDCDLTLSEISRVLRPGGHLVGSVSHLEPYHGFQTVNYTPYGFGLLCERHGLRARRVTPGFDVLSYAMRVMLARLGQEGVDEMFQVFYRKPALNALIDDLCRDMRRSVREANEMKLALCAQFRFVFQKAGGD